MDTASWSHRVQEQKASNNWNAPRLCNALRSSPVCVHGRGQQEPSQENQAQSQLCHLPHLQHFSQAFPLPRVSKTISRTWIHTVSKAECSCFQVAHGGSHHLESFTRAERRQCRKTGREVRQKYSSKSRSRIHVTLLYWQTASLPSYTFHPTQYIEIPSSSPVSTVQWQWFVPSYESKTNKTTKLTLKRNCFNQTSSKWIDDPQLDLLTLCHPPSSGWLGDLISITIAGW